MTFSSATALKLTILTACALALALLIDDRNRWKSTATLRQQQVVAEKAAHSATVANYRAAAAQAREADAANAARVGREQARINERTANDYESRIAAARSHADRLRRDSEARADPRAGGAAPVPGLPASAGAAAQAPGEARLPEAEHRPQAEVAPLGADDALIATEQAIQLDELIKWVRAQAAVAPSN